MFDLGMMLNAEKSVETSLPLKGELSDVIISPALPFRYLL
jgi:hypothetical protein